jgi:hypothetical protein
LFELEVFFHSLRQPVRPVNYIETLSGFRCLECDFLTTQRRPRHKSSSRCLSKNWQSCHVQKFFAGQSEPWFRVNLNLRISASPCTASPPPPADPLFDPSSDPLSDPLPDPSPDSFSDSPTALSRLSPSLPAFAPPSPFSSGVSSPPIQFPCTVDGSAVELTNTTVDTLVQTVANLQIYDIEADRACTGGGGTEDNTEKGEEEEEEEKEEHDIGEEIERIDSENNEDNHMTNLRELTPDQLAVIENNYAESDGEENELEDPPNPNVGSDEGLLLLPFLPSFKL